MQSLIDGTVEANFVIVAATTAVIFAIGAFWFVRRLLSTTPDR